MKHVHHLSRQPKAAAALEGLSPLQQALVALTKGFALRFFE